MPTTTWPPPYRLRISQRAKHVQWRFTAHRGLELIVPSRFDQTKEQYYLEQHRAWIEKIIEKNKYFFTTTTTTQLPEEISFSAFQKTWAIRYVPMINKRVKLIEKPQELVLTCKQDDVEAGVRLLRRWLKHQAEFYLLPLLSALSIQTQLVYEQSQILHATSLWGSCDKKKTISLNTQLLFLPESLIRHVIIHELCHLKHLNHSAAFWKLVTHFDSQCHIHKKALQQAHQFIPAWITRSS